MKKNTEDKRREHRNAKVEEAKVLAAKGKMCASTNSNIF
jgi:hypothetical protein